MYNRIIQIGNLTKDPELRYTAGGIPVASMRIAVTTKHKKADAYVDETLFIGVVVFGKQAEKCGQYLTKGSGVIVEGRLQEQKWEKDGQQHSKMEIVADNVRFMPKRNSAGGDSSEAGKEAPDETTDREPF
jgi:single-strand DNA-binding protein